MGAPVGMQHEANCRGLNAYVVTMENDMKHRVEHGMEHPMDTVVIRGFYRSYVM